MKIVINAEEQFDKMYEGEYTNSIETEITFEILENNIYIYCGKEDERLIVDKDEFIRLLRAINQ